MKGATENALLRLFKHGYVFRPAAMKASPGQRNLPGFYKYLAWIFPIGRALYPAGFCTLQEVGDDQRRDEGLPEAHRGSEGHRPAGEDLISTKTHASDR